MKLLHGRASSSISLPRIRLPQNLLQGFLKRLQTPRSDHLGTLLKLKHLHGDVALIADLFQRPQNGDKIDIPEPRPLQVPVIGMEVGEVPLLSWIISGRGGLPRSSP